jgi:hypothetical protein
MDEFTPCKICLRTPLVGEQVTIMRTGERESAVCDLCLGRPRAAALGEQQRRERVRSLEGAETVIRSWPTPAQGGHPAPVGAGS